MVVGGDLELPHREHVGRVVELALDERDRAARRAGQRLRRRRPVVGGELVRDLAAGGLVLDDAEAHHLRVGEQAVEVRSVAGVGGGEGAAVERGGGGVE